MVRIQTANCIKTQQKKMKQKSNVLERIMQRTSLETKLKVAFQVHDYENWKNGEYFGDAEKYVEVAISEILDHMQAHGIEATNIT